jgi:hypothetical protein
MDAFIFRFAVLISAAGVCTTAVAARPGDSSGGSPAQKLIRDFDLMPKLLSPAKSQTDGSPLKTIARRMTVVHRDLSSMETDEPVQTRERQVVRSLDELIAALEKKCSGTGRGTNPNGGRKQSVIASGDPAFGSLHGVDPNARLWSQLPPKLRDEILQSKTEGFPPGYEALLQSYYQQLSEEKSSDDKQPAAK